MPTERRVFNRIKAIYQFQTLDTFMFAYVCGLRDHIPTTGIRRAIEIFLNRFDISEDEYSLDYAVQVYYKIRDEVEKLGK